MSARTVTLVAVAGLGLVLIGGPLLAVAVQPALGGSGAVAILIGWAGLVLLAAARLEAQRQLRRRVDGIARGSTQEKEPSRRATGSGAGAAHERDAARSQAGSARAEPAAGTGAGREGQPPAGTGAGQEGQPPAGTGTGREGQPPAGTVVAALDPASDLLLDAVGYHRLPRALQDGQPDPGGRLRRAAPDGGARFVLQRCVGSEVTAEEPLVVEVLPVDPRGALPRPRVHPAPVGELELHPAAGADGPDAPELGAAASTTQPQVDRIAVPRTGPTRSTIDAIRAAARTHRLVRITSAPVGDPLLWGGLVLHLTAAGSVCLLSPAAMAGVAGLSDRLRSTLPADGSGGVDAEVVAAAPRDDLALARLAAEQRRAALADHDLALTWEPGSADGPWYPRLEPRRPAAVSVVLPTRRPTLMPTALAMLADQRGVELEVVVALHGDHDPGPVRAALTRSGLPGCVLSLPAALPLGAVLNAAVERTSAPLVLKWDDDDLYGPFLVEDLVLGQRCSGADLTGKAAEFVHLDARGETIWRTPAGADGPSMTLAGGTLLTPRHVLDELRGYPPLPRAVDHHLKAGVAAGGGRVYRVHGFGFVLRRHGRGHTWDAGDDRFLAQAVGRYPGLPEVIGLGAAADHLGVAVPDAPAE